MSIRLVACVGLWGLPALAGLASWIGGIDPAVAGPVGLMSGLGLAAACAVREQRVQA